MNEQNFEVKINDLTFQYQINYTKDSKPNSLTFYYKYKMPVKVPYDTSIDKTCDNFLDIISGRVFGGLMVEKYLGEDIFCYLITDGNYYKIGKSKDPIKRMKDMKTANPNISMICFSQYIPEKFLHDLFTNNRHEREWFKLDMLDVQLVKSLMSIHNQDQANILMRMSRNIIKKVEREKVKDKNFKYEASKPYEYKLTFGKYEGRRLKSMTNEAERNYLRWLYKTHFNRNSILLKHIEVVLGMND